MEIDIYEKKLNLKFDYNRLNPLQSVYKMALYLKLLRFAIESLHSSLKEDSKSTKTHEDHILLLLHCIFFLISNPYIDFFTFRSVI